MSDEHRTPAEIEAEIVAARARLSRDLGLLQDRLTVEGLVDEVRLQMRGQIDAAAAQVRSQVSDVAGEVAAELRDQVGTAAKGVARTAKANPWPVAAIGLGLAWLAVSALKPAPKVKKPRVGMAPVKPVLPETSPDYDFSPADAAAAKLEQEADQWASGVLANGSQPVPPYDAEPSWVRDPDDLTLRRP